MSDAYTIPSFFSDDPRGGALSYDQLQARRKIAAALATRQRGFPKNIGEGLTYLGESLGEMMGDRRLAGYEAAQQARDNAARQALTGDSTPAAPAAVPGPVSAAPDIDPQVLAQEQGVVQQGSPRVAALAQPKNGPIAEATATRQPLTPAEATQQPSMSIEEWKQRVARNESGGQRDPYSTVGERSRKGDYPYGKYQVMGANVPKWTAAYLGREMTPKEFLADPDAQEQVASARGSEYMTKYGPIGAAQAWFGGENWRKDPRATDTLGTHVAEYTRRFNIPLVDREQVVRSAAPRDPSTFAFAPGGDELPPGATPASAPAREDIVAALAQKQAPVQPVQQQQVAQAASPPVPPTQAPLVTPQAIPKAPAVPAKPVAPGEEPSLRGIIDGTPALRQQMDNARRIALDPALSPAMQAAAQARYQELEKRANDVFTKQWTVWHERTKAAEAHALTEKDKELQTTKLRGEAEDAAEKRILTHRLGGQEPQKFFDNFAKEQTTADIAAKVRDDNRIIIKAVKDGVIMGTGAGWRLNAAKLAAWAAQNGYASEVAANTEIMRALGGSRIREALSQVNPTGVASNTDLLLARQLSGAEPTMEPKSFMQLLHRSSEYNAKLLNDYEDKKDYYLAGTRAERQFNLVTPPTAPQARVDEMLANRDDKAKRAAFDDTYGEGSSALEIERFKRRQRRGQ